MKSAPIIKRYTHIINKPYARADIFNILYISNRVGFEPMLNDLPPFLEYQSSFVYLLALPYYSFYIYFTIVAYPISNSPSTSIRYSPLERVSI